MGAERPLSAWSDRRLGEHGRAICQQHALPTQPEVAASQAAVLEEWARRWRQRGPHDLPGRVELGLVADIAAQLRRLATTPTRQADPQRETSRER
jgi:hypothetical protein